MTMFILASFTRAVLGWLMGFLSLFLILLVLIQRGRGGGLAGTLGGPGGQSAFGSKAGDTFTVITVVAAAVWGFVCAFTMWLLGTPAAPEELADLGGNQAVISSDEGDTSDPTDGIVIPKLDGSGIGGTESDTETPSMELTPAKPGDNDTKPTDADDAESPADDSTPAADDSTPPADNDSAADSGASTSSDSSDASTPDEAAEDAAEDSSTSSDPGPDPESEAASSEGEEPDAGGEEESKN